MEPEIMGSVRYDMKEVKTYFMMIAILILGVLPPCVGEFLYDSIHPNLNRLLREREKLDRDLPIDFAESMKIDIEVESIDGQVEV